MRKRIVGLLLAVVLLVPAVPALAHTGWAHYCNTARAHNMVVDGNGWGHSTVTNTNGDTRYWHQLHFQAWYSGGTGGWAYKHSDTITCRGYV